jgi:serine/threonine-protein kinase HipA
MPLAAAEHGHRTTSAFLWGLLPDNPEVIAQWARVNGVSRYDVVQLLAHVGEDCAGAVQLTTPEKVEEVIGAATTKDERTSIDWLSNRDVGHLLAGLRRNPAAGRTHREQGQFSLAGAQPKTALYQDERGRWGVPRGRVPSNRILKPPVLDLDDLAYNENACLQLARELGLAAVMSTVERFGDEVAIVVERYDRVRANGVLQRVHQEDMCQALGVMPTRKYESDGGPGVTDIAAVIDRHSDDAEADLSRFVDATICNWLIAGTDAHAKNYALLLGTASTVRLAPLYDVITVLPYPRLASGRVLLAMGVNGERDVANITGSHWRALARAVGVSPERVLERIADLARGIPGAIGRVLAHQDDDGVTRATVERLLAPVVRHARRCLRQVA